MAARNGLALKSISIGPAKADKNAEKGKATYSAAFSLSWEGNDAEIVVTVATGQGWDDAKILACEKIKELGMWLVKTAETEKSAPHTTQYL